MSFETELFGKLQGFDGAAGDVRHQLERIKAEIEFAAQLLALYPERRGAWEPLILRAADDVRAALASGGAVGQSVADAEKSLAPIGEAAKSFTIHCVGHAHIDMNWMWGWPETVATTNDTFTTVDQLMSEFPDFRFSQSQASVYQILKDYLPELYAKVKQRVAEGRWEVTASQWVEGDKNLASGEILCRHLLYTRRFFKQEFGMDYEAVKIDWEPDTFGHARTVPTILNKGGVRRYYLHRSAHGPKLFWWQGPDGARVLVFDDCDRGYNGQINPGIINGMADFCRATGLKDYLFVYGVGDHGGGPTRRDLMMAGEMAAWPIFPVIKLSTTDAFYTAAEQAKNLPVIDRELNYVFEGCYSSQSNIKRANRKSENALVEAEMAALLGKAVAGLPYPAADLFTGWRHAMFNQFHDILPGSGVKATYEHAQGLYQEITALTSMIKTRALRAIAAKTNTAALCSCALDKSTPGAALAPGLGAGQGEFPRDHAISRRGVGSACCDPFVVFNPSPWPRTEVITAQVWDREYPDEQIAVTDDEGKTFPAQILGRGHYWGHSFTTVAFPAADVAGLGYRTFNVARSVTPGTATGCSGDGKGTIENEFFRVTVDQASGAISALLDKRTGANLVPEGGHIGLLEYLLEAPHPMTAWILGQMVKSVPFTRGGTIECSHLGPHLAAVRSRHKLNDSTFTLDISLAAGVPRIDFELEVNWLERGAPEIGVPALKVSFPLAAAETEATFECPNGSVARSTNPAEILTHTVRRTNSYSPGNPGIALQPAEVPAQKWVDLTGTTATGERIGMTVLNDTKYGHSVQGNTVNITLLRSSYDPDPLPELGRHVIRFAVQPHGTDWSVSDAARAGYAFNFPFNFVGAGLQAGDLPLRKGCAEILTPNVMLSGMKQAEDSEALIVRLYEMEGKPTTARLHLDTTLIPAGAHAVETDVLEQPLPSNTARLAGDVLEVEMPAFGQVTVMLRGNR